MMEVLLGPILCSVAPQYPNPPGSELDKMRPFCEIDASPHRLFMSRSCLLFALVASFLFPTLARSARAETALAALRSLPPRYSYSVLRLSADNGRPTPPAWYILARDQTRRGLPTNITISPRGRIISERPSLNPRARINGLSPISIGRMGIDSTNAWNMARQFSSERGRRLGSVSYSLEQHGRGASPVWSVWCYDRSGRYIGFLSILASTGAVISFR